ncbi:uncharacterized protein LOC106470809 [Limulus polyphemus]|uniref:Uncharacterized protein LOC106470809 n=1 Tax=Limulus polyphemus TaxID=6850 RepID=A0ABM1TJF7_LIMPO|nr:uncharacterized protein LOC106470809 [Limulus polyphemus]
MACQKRKVLRCIENCSAYPPMTDLRAVTLKFLLPNRMPHLQRCDPKIVKNLKHYYRKHLIPKMITWYDAGKDVEEFKMSLLDATTMVKFACSCVRKRDNKNCFWHWGFIWSSDAAEEEEDIDTYDEVTRLQQLNIIDSEAIINVDGDLAITRCQQSQKMKFRLDRKKMMMMIADRSYQL